MDAFRMDSSRWAVGPDALSSSHHTQHGLSRRAFLGGAAGQLGHVRNGIFA
jgi:hypothetical protein